MISYEECREGGAVRLGITYAEMSPSFRFAADDRLPYGYLTLGLRVAKGLLSVEFGYSRLGLLGIGDTRLEGGNKYTRLEGRILDSRLGLLEIENPRSIPAHHPNWQGL